MTKMQRLLFHICLGLGCLFLADLWKMQVVLGGHSLFFSALNIVGPLVGFWGGSWVVFVVLLMKRFIAWTFLGFSLLSPFSTYLPTLCAAWYWNMPNKIIRFFLPVACMVAFMFHPVGAQAWVYTLYWLIPIMIYFFPNKSLFTHALAATFIQHAVGSVIWLYCVSSTSALWYNLLPVVIVERLIFASGMVIVVKLVQVCRLYLVRIFTSFKLSHSFFG